MTYAMRIRGREVPLGESEAEARQRFSRFLSECAIGRQRSYRLLDPRGEVVTRGDEVGAVPFWVSDPGAGLD